MKEIPICFEFTDIRNAVCDPGCDDQFGFVTEDENGKELPEVMLIRSGNDREGEYGISFYTAKNIANLLGYGDGEFAFVGGTLGLATACIIVRGKKEAAV